MEDTRVVNSITESAQADPQPKLDSKKTAVFVPTREELFELLKHWVKSAIGDELDRFNGCSYGRKDLLWTDEKLHRAHEISEMLGEEGRIDEAVEEAYAEMAQECDRNTWIVFRYGTKQEQQDYHNAPYGSTEQAMIEDRAAEAERGGVDEFCKFEFERVAAVSAIVPKVVERVFREGTEAEQEALLKEELRRYATKLEGYIAAEPSLYRRCFDEYGYDDPIENCII